MNLIDRIDALGRRAPDGLAHVSPNGRQTYGELVSGSDRVAGFVQAALADDASPIVIVGHKEPEMLLGFLGSVKAGHPYVPVDASVPRQRVQRIVDQSGARLVLTPESIRQAALAGPARTRLTGLGRSDPYYVMFTSGSTGEPKGVAITLGCLTSFVEWMLGEQAFSPGQEVFLNQAPFSFDLSVMDLYLSLATGGTLVSLTSAEIGNPRTLYRSLATSGVTTWVSTPSFAEVCLAERRFDASLLPGVRRFLFCGETLSPAVALGLLERFPEAAVWNTYGPTEATVATTSVRIERETVARYPTLPVGYPRPDSQIVVLDERGQAVGEGQRGEIVIAGPHVSPGYWRRPDLTERSFFQLQSASIPRRGRAPQGLETTQVDRPGGADRDGSPVVEAATARVDRPGGADRAEDGPPNLEAGTSWAYRTGDWGHFEGGLLFFEGRMDSQIKLHGYRIELGDVEANLRALPGVRDAVVVPLYRGGRLDCLAAFVIVQDQPREAASFDATQRLRRELAERLPAYMVPRVVHAVASFPLTPNGKADRQALAQALG